MNYLDICKEVAIDVGIGIPTSIIGSTVKEYIELNSIMNAAGTEISRRFDWSPLRKETSMIGTGALVEHVLPSNYSRMIDGNAVTYNSIPVKGGLSAEEFKSLPSVSGVPRFYFISNKTIQFWPYTPNGNQVKILFQSTQWVIGATGGPAIRFANDLDTSVFSEDLLVKAGISRWRRQKGMDYQDYAAEYEQVLKDEAEFDIGERSP